MEMTRKDFLQVGSLTAVSAGLGMMAVDAGQAEAMKPRAGAAAPVAVVAPREEVVVLCRAAFGPRPGEVEQVARMGVDNWIDWQLHPEAIDDSALDAFLASRFPTLNKGALELFQGYQPGGDPGPRRVYGELAVVALLRAAQSRRQLLEVMVEFWTDHFNIFQPDGQCKWLKTVDDREVIRKHALGKFGDLLTASAQSPAMLEYLDNRQNVKGVPNENYARELLELHTMGVDGPYEQADVLGVARCFTGWTYRVRGGDVEFLFLPRQHDSEAKEVLGHTIPAGGGLRHG